MAEFVGSDYGLFDILDDSDDWADDGLEAIIEELEDECVETGSEDTYSEEADEPQQDYSVEYIIPDEYEESGTPAELPEPADVLWEEYYAMEAFIAHNAGEVYADDLSERIREYASRLSFASRYANDTLQ